MKQLYRCAPGYVGHARGNRAITAIVEGEGVNSSRGAACDLECERCYFINPACRLLVGGNVSSCNSAACRVVVVRSGTRTLV